ncbi:MAG: UDP-N-acetylglucosamine 2-epimerase [Proteobacteria bacterium]|nr:UDP-N-acetylglucosamine 2-epimerase [Pseudomonadota bacterium]
MPPGESIVTGGPEGVEAGVATLVGVETQAITAAVQRLLDDPKAYAAMANVTSPYGDGHAAERIVELIRTWSTGTRS